MRFLKTNFTRYRWLLLVAAAIGGVYSGNEVLRQLPPGTDLVSAIIAIYAMSRNERDQIADQVADRLWQKLGALSAAVDLHKSQIDRVNTRVDVVAHRLEHLSGWATSAHGYLPAEPAGV